MADNKKISALTNRPAGSLAGTDEVVLRVGASNFKASLTSIATWIASRAYAIKYIFNNSICTC